MSTKPTRERIEARIAARNDALDRVTAFVEQGVMAAKISEEDAELLIAAARTDHAVNVRMLRDLLDTPES